jgi:hypothetical protein
MVNPRVHEFLGIISQPGKRQKGDVVALEKLKSSYSEGEKHLIQKTSKEAAIRRYVRLRKRLLLCLTLITFLKVLMESSSSRKGILDREALR